MGCQVLDLIVDVVKQHTGVDLSVLQLALQCQFVRL